MFALTTQRHRERGALGIFAKREGVGHGAWGTGDGVWGCEAKSGGDITFYGSYGLYFIDIYTSSYLTYFASMISTILLIPYYTSFCLSYDV
jgi:hypothetical protein